MGPTINWNSRYYLAGRLGTSFKSLSIAVILIVISKLARITPK